jgi:amino acid transporter
MVDASVPGQGTAVEKSASVATDIPDIDLKAAGYGLRQEALSSLETLAQSISGPCPTLSPFVTIPLVFTLAGNGTWLAYILATGGVFSLAWCISRFARYIASPGSLYSYARVGTPAVARGCGRVEFGVGLCRGQREQYMRFLLPCQRDAEFHHRGFILFCCRPFTHLSEAISIFQMLIWFLLQVFRK